MIKVTINLYTFIRHVIKNSILNFFVFVEILNLFFNKKYIYKSKN